MNNIKVIIIGVTHHNTYSMVRCFGEKGIMPTLILYGSEESYILQSRYILEAFVEKNEETSLQLLKNKKDEWTDSIIISCTDAIASIIDLNYDYLKKYYHVFNCGEAGKLTYYMNKLVQTKCAMEVGFDVPMSLEGTLNEVMKYSIPYPCIIKPIESIHGGKKIYIFQNDNELKKIAPSFKLDEKIIIQQFIKKDYELVVVGLAIQDVVIIPAFIHKHRDDKGGTTYATVKDSQKLSDSILNQCKLLIKKIKYQGLFGIELIKQADKYFFIEINLRNDATTYAVAKAGVNLPVLLFENISTGILPTQQPQSISEIHSIVEFSDFIHVLKRKISPINWFLQMKSSECKYFFSKDDCKPYKKYRKQFFKFLITRITNF